MGVTSIRSRHRYSPWYPTILVVGEITRALDTTTRQTTRPGRREIHNEPNAQQKGLQCRGEGGGDDATFFFFLCAVSITSSRQTFCVQNVRAKNGLVELENGIHGENIKQSKRDAHRSRCSVHWRVQTVDCYYSL